MVRGKDKPDDVERPDVDATDDDEGQKKLMLTVSVPRPVHAEQRRLLRKDCVILRAEARPVIFTRPLPTLGTAFCRVRT